MVDKYFLDSDAITRSIDTEGTTRPAISTMLDSIRAYQWEVTFKNFSAETDFPDTIKKPLTLAAKQVNGIGMSVEDIEVNRVNDKVYYPGRPSMEEAVITFDNLAKTQVDKLLYEYMAKVYDPRTGVLGDVDGNAGSTGGTIKQEIQLLQLASDGSPRNVIRLFGAYPKQITHGEYNYSTNEFHTIEMTFRYDFFVNTKNAEGIVDTGFQKAT